MFGFLKDMTSGFKSIKEVGKNISEGFSRCKEKLSIMKDIVTLKGGFLENMGKLFWNTDKSLEEVETDVAVDASKREVEKVEDEIIQGTPSAFDTKKLSGPKKRGTNIEKGQYPEGYTQQDFLLFLKDKGVSGHDAPIPYDRNREYSRKEFIKLVTPFAKKLAGRAGMPASVMIAQMLMESGDGNSGLTRDAFNFFGIKCHNYWNGYRRRGKTQEDYGKGLKTIKDNFRGYISIEHSMYDYVSFLKEQNTGRYGWLFKKRLGRKEFLTGVRKSGYATHKEYIPMASDIITRNGLDKIDQEIDNESKYA